jgi:hypothetical protein
MISMEGVTHVTIQGITLEAMRGDAVLIKDGSNNLIAGCTIRNIGNWAIKILGGSNHGVKSCDIYYIGRGGVQVEGGDQHTLTKANHYVVNNEIHHFSRLAKTYQFAVRLRGVGNRIAHNVIHHAPHDAMDWRGNYNIIELNKIYNVCLESEDAGAIQSDRDLTSRGNIIRYNFIYNVVGRDREGSPLGAFMVYLDSNQSGDEFFGNIFCKGSGRTMIMVNGGRDVIIKNNIFIDGPAPVEVTTAGVKSHRNALVSAYKEIARKKIDRKSPPWSTAFPKLAKYPDNIDELAIPVGNEICNNIFYKTKDIKLDTFEKEVPKDIVKIENNYKTDEDPGFVDAVNLNFQLKEGSIVYKKIPGFQKIPFDKIGLYKDEYRKEL